MALLEKHLIVKKSTLPNSGKGLFTRIPIARGTRIVEYKGRVTTWKEVKDDDGKNGYIFYITRNRVIDALPYKKALGRYANDARGFTRIKGILNNSEYIVDDGKCFIEATKPIAAGAEIFVDYGKDYWKVMRDNWKLELDKAREKKKRESRKKKRNTVKRTRR